ncbi:hypothetical protein Tco_0960160 [Tanacetum coccineum]
MNNCTATYSDVLPGAHKSLRCRRPLHCLRSWCVALVVGQPATDESPEVKEQTVLETFSNISPENKGHYDAAKEAGCQD